MSMLNSKKLTVSVGGKEITFETGKIARQAGGAVLVQCGETVVFNTACASPEASPDIDFFPLRVDYQEKFSSAGKTLSGFIKREGRPSEKEVLVSRLIDRPLRPMFPEGYYNEVQVLSFVWSFDQQNTPEPLAICGASAALVISDIPLLKPIAAVRVGQVDGNFIINPTLEEQAKSKLDLLIAGTKDAVLMIEGYANFLSEEEVLQAIEEGHRSIKIIAEALEKWQKELGKEKNLSTLRVKDKSLLETFKAQTKDSLCKALRIADKKEREKEVKAIKTALLEPLLTAENVSPSKLDLENAFKETQAFFMRQMILNENKRSDGRSCTDIRPIEIEQGILPRTHGSSLFTRGETQTVAVCTLGGESMGQRFEDLQQDGLRRFYMQYSFPPFSVGEVGRMGSPGRREVGHGKLAERALQAALPSKEAFPYVIRLESNITESNGSSSMATVCGGCLSLMDAGVPIERPVSGIAMGLILEQDKFAILSDILGLEDALGDMDFKVTGDKNGITAFQMDIKVEGISIEIMKKAIAQAKLGIHHILDCMLKACPTSKTEMSSYAPRIETMQVKQSKIAAIIGPGGKQIRAIVEETGVQMDIDDNGVISITSANLEGIKRAKEIIAGLIAEAEVGKIYQGKVVSVVDFGMFVEILPGKEGLCHISEFDKARTASLEGLVKVGDIVPVKLIGINDRKQLQLSRRAALE